MGQGEGRLECEVYKNKQCSNDNCKINSVNIITINLEREILTSLAAFTLETLL